MSKTKKTTLFPTVISKPFPFYAQYHWDHFHVFVSRREHAEKWELFSKIDFNKDTTMVLASRLLDGLCRF